MKIEYFNLNTMEKKFYIFFKNNYEDSIFQLKY